MKQLKITTHWTAQEAHCIYQLLDDLKSAVWTCYGSDIISMFNDIKCEQEAADKNTEFDDEIGF